MAKMNEKEQELSLCCVFNFLCCPPIPKRITEKVVFIPPSPPTYDMDLIDEDSCVYDFLPRAKLNTKTLESIVKQEARMVKTNRGLRLPGLSWWSRGNSIAVLYVNCNRERQRTVLYSHGNAVDLGQIHRFCVKLSCELGCDVVSYDYSGYGKSGGIPTEKNVYADIRAAWDYVLNFHEPRPDRIVLFGLSLGTAPTIDLATEVECAGVILECPFMSTLRVLCLEKQYSTCIDKFKK